MMMQLRNNESIWRLDKIIEINNSLKFLNANEFENLLINKSKS